MIPIDDIKKKMGIATAISGAFNYRATSKTAPAKFEINNPIFKKVLLDMIPVKRPTT
jgi:hypothetical protein